MTRLGRAGALFLTAFVGALVLYGDLFGSFADSDRVFQERYQHDATRVRDIVASYLLLGAALMFAWFVSELADLAERHMWFLRMAGFASASSMALAAVAAATTPLSIWFGARTGDPGIDQGQGVLPQFAYVALALGALAPAGLMMIIAARSPRLLPRWLALASYPSGALVGVSALLFVPVILLPLWVTGVVTTVGRSSL